MNNHNIPAQFEEDIRRAFNVPPIRSDFVDRLEIDLINRANQARQSEFHARRPHLAWALVGLFVLAIMFATLLLGPQRVYAAVQRFLGYIPGFGLVESNAPLRILAQPVSLTQAGITVAVNRAVLTATETQIDYGVSGVPLSAYPQNESVAGCTESPYLILPDGTRQALEAPIPPDVNEVTFVLPCIFNTLPGSVPSNWRLPLRFVPAPPDFNVLPIVDLTTPTSPTSGTPTSLLGSTLQGDHLPEAEVQVKKVIETADGYILLGVVHSSLPEEKWLEITGVPVITDAQGNKVSYSYPSDVQPWDDSTSESGDILWALQFKAGNIAFPITLEFPISVITEIALPSPVVIPLDVGNAPQIGQTWTLNREITLERFNIRLVSVTADSLEGYTFLFEANDSGLYDLGVEIEGVSAIGGGGGRDGSGQLMKSLSFIRRPIGHLNLRIIHLWRVEATSLLSTTWSPLTTHQREIDTPSEVCFDENTITTLPNPPSSLGGAVIISQINPKTQIVRANLTGAQTQILIQGSAHAALSPDGDNLAYVTEEGMVIQSLSGSETRLIPGQFGGNLSWSPDMQRIAGVNADGQYGIFVLRLKDNQMQWLSNLGYESLAGWSPEGTRLYYTIPGHTEDFLLRAVDLKTEIITDLFALEKSSRKAPMAVLSPDGQWVAYRGEDNRSLYLKPMNGEPARLILEQSGLAINSLVWEKRGRLLGVSLITEEDPEGTLYLISPTSCDGYRIPGVSGALMGVIIP